MLCNPPIQTTSTGAVPGLFWTGHLYKFLSRILPHVRVSTPTYGTHSNPMTAQGWGHRLDCGDVDAEFASGSMEHVIEGETRVGGQEHFYLEPNCAIVIPKERDEIQTFSSTQARAAPDALSLSCLPRIS